jgi:multidrug efflux pump subunit AcrA (membrane-fusion protein)
MKHISLKSVGIFFIVVIVFIVVGVGVQQYRSSREYVSPRLGDVIETIYGLGTVTADFDYHLRTGVAVGVKRIFVQEGSAVSKGDSLIQLDEILFRSPLSGVVTHIAFKEGELVSPQVPVVSVTNLEKLHLEVNLEQQSVLRVKKGQIVYISFESMRNERLKGQVTAIYPRENQFIVRVEMKDWPEANILPGMTADVGILIGEKKQVLLIPLRSLVSGQVTRVRAGRHEKIRVKLGAMDEEWAEVLESDLLLSDQILVRK